ncbi:GNAT family N-acetyltransferase [Deinococcus hopiensis]|uniref:GNAT family N-acetyltransferase n=1 Tax=Deinococcus hopiensis TaxID=309885 RepID=UPI000A033343|nr:GNAT family N-acetyltransferase [Deinococcus hopiensis]
MNWRPATASDAPFLHELHHANRPDLQALPPEVREPLLALQYQAREREYLRQYPHAQREMICRGERAVGAFLTAGRSGHLLLIDLAVHPQAQGRGLGTLTLKWLQTRARAEGHPLVLRVMRDNPAVRLYAREGFRVWGEEGLRLQMGWAP